MHTGDLLDMLRRRYAAPAYALFAEVGDATAGRSRIADAMAMGLWPSRGVELNGFEIKVDRRDWLRELKNPEKAERIARFCDFWWLVVSDSEIVKDGELPPNWGMLVPRGKDLSVAVVAKNLDPAPITRKFLAALLRAAHKVSPMENAVIAARKEGIEIGMERAKREWTVEHARREIDGLRESIDAFEKASGLKIDSWNGGSLGEAVKIYSRLGNPLRRREFEYMRNAAVNIQKEVDDLLALVPE